MNNELFVRLSILLNENPLLFTNTLEEWEILLDKDFDLIVTKLEIQNTLDSISVLIYNNNYETEEDIELDRHRL